MTTPREITPQDLQPMLAQEPPFILDVRLDWEVRLCPFPHAVHVPLHELGDRHDEIPRDRPVITVCHHGVRSLQAALFLRSVGVAEARSLRGGTDAWAMQVDPRMPRY